MARFLTVSIRVAVAVCLLAACKTNDNQPTGNGGNGSGSTLPGEYDRAELLSDLADNVIVPVYEQAATSVAALDAAVRQYQSSLTSTTAAANALVEAQTKWRQAMHVWQQAELLQVGPAALEGTDAGGRSLRDEIYSWPIVNSCHVDIEIVSQDYKQSSFITDNLVTRYGLDVLEYLLFYNEGDNTCPSSANINATGDWNALSDAELQTRRAEYAAVVAADVKTQVEALQAAWAASGGDFGAKLNLKASDSPYGSLTEAMDAMFQALFYVELIVKDEKVGLPTGKTPGCSSAPCIEDVESLWAQASHTHVQANFKALQQLFTAGGGDAYGFDDALVDAGAPELAETLNAEIVAAIAAAETVSQPYDTVLANDPSGLDALFETVKSVTDLMKGEFVTRLMLQIPSEGAGDSD